MTATRATQVTAPAVVGAGVCSVTGSTLVLSDNRTRRGAWITNNSAQIVSLGFGVAAVDGHGIVLPATSAPFSIAPWTGDVYAISHSGTVNIGVVEI